MCDQEFCSICVIRISFPVGFRKSKNILFQATKKCCVNCLSAVFYLRNNPPLDHLLTVNSNFFFRLKFLQNFFLLFLLFLLLILLLLLLLLFIIYTIIVYY